MFTYWLLRRFSHAAVHVAHGQQKCYPQKTIRINVHIVMVTPRVVMVAMAAESPLQSGLSQ